MQDRQMQPQYAVLFWFLLIHLKINERENMQSPYLNLYLGRRKRLWLTHCKKLNKKPSTLIREWIDQQLSISESSDHFFCSEKTQVSLKSFAPSNVFCKKENFP